MTPSQIEAWALHVISRVVRGGPLEDSRIELKADWIDTGKAARRVAGHANAAGGESILWLFGVDETRGVVGVKSNDLSLRISKLNSSFDGTPPSVKDVIVSTAIGDVVALQFETDRAPYVVKTGSTGGVEKEVPWREGTRVRSATRAELIGLIHPYTRVPDFDLISGHALSRPTHIGPGEHDYGSELKIVLDLYVVPIDDQRVVIPRHSCECRVLSSVRWTSSRRVRLLPPKLPQNPLSSFVMGIGSEERTFSDSPLVRFSAHEAIFDGPGRIRCEWELYGHGTLPVDRMDAEFVFRSVRSFAPAVVTCTFEKRDAHHGEDFWSALPARS